MGKPLSTIGDSKTVDVMDKVIVVGNPARIDGTVTTDVIINILGKYLLMSAPISPGSSGGAVLNEKGEVIGVTMGTFPGDKNQNQNLNAIVPSNYLTPLVEKAKKPGDLKPLSTDGVTGYRLTWRNNSYEFSLCNQRRENIQVMRCMVMFYDKNDKLICVDELKPVGIMPAGSAKRIQRFGPTAFLDHVTHYSPGGFRETIFTFSSDDCAFNPSSIKPLVKRTEVRILDLNIIPNYYPPKKGVTGGKFAWSEKPDAIYNIPYVFSLHNSLNKTVKNVKGLVIFYDDKEVPIDSDSFDTLFTDVEITAGETETVSRDIQSNSVKRLTKRVEIKILDFTTVE